MMTKEEIRTLGQKTKNENRKRSIKIWFISLIVVGVLFLGFKIVKGDFTFLGRDTAIVNAEVIDVKWLHLGKGYYYQEVFYQFQIDNKVYAGNYLKGRSNGKISVGDMVWVQYASGDPEINKKR